ncbi:MAG: hypothetical protein U1E28_19710 [Beijerinckiaceae bacterium]
MQIVPFSEFARRRGAPGRPEAAAAASPVLPAADRWAALHSEQHSDSLDAEIIEFDQAGENFWDDLQFRIAYPTHRLRRH